MKPFSYSNKYFLKIITAIVISTTMLLPTSITASSDSDKIKLVIDSVTIKEPITALKNQDYLTINVKFSANNIQQALFVCSAEAPIDVFSTDAVIYIDQLTLSATNEYEYKIPLDKIDSLTTTNGKKTLYLQFGAVGLNQPVQYPFTFDVFEIYRKCDINHDGVIDVSDVEALQESQYYSLPTVSAEAQKLDVNQDGFVNVIDIAEISLEISAAGN